MRFLMILLACLVMSCGGDGILSPKANLNTMAHEKLDVSWEGSPVRADIRWRFISSQETQAGVSITGSWNITLRNPSNSTYLVNIARLTFIDVSGFQIAEYAPVSGVETVTVSAGQTNPRQGNFYISVATVELANSVTDMNVWASIY